MRLQRCTQLFPDYINSLWHRVLWNTFNYVAIEKGVDLHVLSWNDSPTSHVESCRMVQNSEQYRYGKERRATVLWFLRAHTCGNAQNKAIPKLSKLNLCGEEGSTLVKSVVGEEFNLL